MTFVIVIFFASLAGIIGLFGVKEWEQNNNRFIAPGLRAKLDQWAFLLQDLLIALRKDAEKIPPELLHFARLVIHEIALLAAASLRFLEHKAHDLADFVSHKRNFVRKAPRSEFLKKVIEHKQGTAQTLDAEEERGQNS